MNKYTNIEKLGVSVFTTKLGDDVVLAKDLEPVLISENTVKEDLVNALDRINRWLKRNNHHPLCHDEIESALAKARGEVTSGS